jgi:HEPN domain-containing protein
MSEHEEAQRLLIMAKKDLKALRGMGQSTDFDDEIFGFHVQQAIEKALKAWLASMDHPYPYKHNLLMLFGLIEERGGEVKQFLDLVRYNSFAIQFRYEQADEVRQELDRDAAIRQVTEIVEHVERLVGR